MADLTLDDIAAMRVCDATPLELAVLDAAEAYLKTIVRLKEIGDRTERVVQLTYEPCCSWCWSAAAQGGNVGWSGCTPQEAVEFLEEAIGGNDAHGTP